MAWGPPAQGAPRPRRSNFFNILITINIDECWPLWLSHVGRGRLTGGCRFQFIDFAKSRGCQTPSSLAMLLHTEDLQSTFSNVEIAIRMYMSIMVSNCSGERSFSKMALIKSKLRSSMSDRWLSALELLSVENDVLECVSFSDIIEQFAAAKSRKRLWINSKHEPSYADMQHRNMMTVGVYRPII